MPDSWGRHSEALNNLGSGNLEGGGIGERVGIGEVSLQATWDQGVWDQDTLVYSLRPPSTVIAKNYFVTKQQKTAFLKGSLKVTMILKTLVEEYIFISFLGTKVLRSS